MVRGFILRFGDMRDGTVRKKVINLCVIVVIMWTLDRLITTPCGGESWCCSLIYLCSR